MLSVISGTLKVPIPTIVPKTSMITVTQASFERLKAYNIKIIIFLKQI